MSGARVENNTQILILNATNASFSLLWARFLRGFPVVKREEERWRGGGGQERKKSRKKE